MYAVLGASGKIGREVVSALCGAGASVRALVHGPGSETVAGCDVVRCDVTDPRALSRALADVEAVHVIVPTGPPSGHVPAQMRRCIDSIAEAIADARPSRVLAVSDYGAHLPSGRGLPALFHEMETRFSGLAADLVVLRSAEHMENWARLIHRVAATSTLESMHHGIYKLFPTVSARDVGRIAAEILLEDWPRDRRVIHVEGPRRYAAIDVAAAFSSILEREIKTVALDRGVWEATLEQAGLSPPTAHEIAASFDACNAGLIDVDPRQSEVRTGSIKLVDALRRAIAR